MSDLKAAREKALVDAFFAKPDTPIDSGPCNRCGCPITEPVAVVCGRSSAFHVDKDACIKALKGAVERLAESGEEANRVYLQVSAERNKLKATLSMHESVLRAHSKEICYWCAHYAGEYYDALIDSDDMQDFIDCTENKQGEKVRVCIGCAESAESAET